jgi:hypothetical protein
MNKLLKLATALVVSALVVAGLVPAALAQPYPTTGGYGSATVQQTGASIHALRPLDYGALGSYSKAMNSGIMAAGLAAGSPIFSFQWTGTTNTANVAVIRSISVSAVNAGTGFTAGLGSMSVYPARAFTVVDSGGTAGTLTGDNGNLRTSMPATKAGDIRIASTATLTAGTRTLDTDPIGSVEFACSATASATMIGPTKIWEAKVGEYPFVLAANEGFVIQATVTATGTWGFSVWVEWDELPAF